VNPCTSELQQVTPLEFVLGFVTGICGSDFQVFVWFLKLLLNHFVIASNKEIVVSSESA
jgi:hypothetical protein